MRQEHQQLLARTLRRLRECGTLVANCVVDFSAGDLAQAEVENALYQALPHPNVRITHTYTGSLNTLAAGFCVGALALNPQFQKRGKGHAARVFSFEYVNVAPRRDTQNQNTWEHLVLAVLKNGGLVFGPNAAFALSFIRPEIEVLYLLDVEGTGHQFRSRDDYPTALARLCEDDDSNVIDTVSGDKLRELIPDPPESSIGWFDNFGNGKTTLLSRIHATQGGEPGNSLDYLRLPESIANLPNGTPIRIRVGNRTEQAAVLTNGPFAVPQGVMAFSIGSTTFAFSDGSMYRAREIFLRGGNAQQVLANGCASAIPQVGEKVEIFA